MEKVNYTISERMPTVLEHKQLWESVGWGSLNTEMSERSLATSLYGVTVTIDGAPIGMGRIVGDGVMYFYIQDVAVLPSFQGQGVGKAIMRHLLTYIEKRRHDDGIAFIGLFAAEGKTEFYEKFGFKNGFPQMTGMLTVLD
ncbi:GNAT family N-acetyltransferase [Paenibacillus sp. UMB4589-SE434]|uniref:GNAT family N-acetyltransferase n=1 Tax=Paenibacillus sp. UMB4589-SE434 TaxID=3046314 RepID=UPI00254E09B2|nr:GNAT family N-acetyltransferase [Paenibacillus sp. UMB4589-SE434]MDK8181759.1 GNAT family N-acetyltransferase [Paenibacillus sp. UMB4589-SE434]